MTDYDLVQILKRLVQIPSENPPGETKAIIEYLISEIFTESLGFSNEVVSYSKRGIELHNLISKIGNGPQKIVFSGHLDVVPSGDLSLWNFPPFSAQIEGNRLYGRGSSDMKSGIAMLIGTIMNLKEYPQFLEKFTLLFIGSADEEAGMTGAYTLRKRAVMKDAILLIVAEPTKMNIGIAQKGLLWVDVKIQGKAAHASMPNEGLNSIEGAMKLIPLLHKCVEGKKNDILGKSTINVGKIQGGVAHNIVPEETKISIDFRLIPEQSAREIIDILKLIEITPYKYAISITHTLPGLQADLNHPFLQNLKNNTKTEFIGLPYATEAAILIDSKHPVPFLIYGPGNPEVIHKENEYVELEDIFKSTKHLTKTLVETYL